MTQVPTQETVSYLALFFIRRGGIAASDLLDASITEAKLSFDPATQAELDALAAVVTTAQTSAGDAEAAANSALSVAIAAQAAAGAVSVRLQDFAFNPVAEVTFDAPTWRSEVALSSLQEVIVTGPVTVIANFVSARTGPGEANGAISLELEPAGDWTGERIAIKQYGPNGVTITPDGAEEIDYTAGAISLVNDTDFVVLLSDGNRWHIVGENA